MVLEIELQQPYIPVCLMSTVSVGTIYFNDLDMFRKFRDEVMLEWGIIGELLVKGYYHMGDKVSRVCMKHPRIGKLLLNFWFKPLVKIFKKFY